MNSQILQTYKLLHQRWGDQHWWPAETRLEMMVGAILTQNTAWTHVEKALTNLRTHNALDLDVLNETPNNTLAEWIKPAGFFNQKTVYIKEMASVIKTRFHNSLDELFKLETSTLRTELLSWKGIGKETADCILLYAGKRPVFVIDAYTKRVSLQHQWCSKNTSYDELAERFTKNLPLDTQLFNEYHALLVRLCKEHCRTKPQCDTCPLFTSLCEHAFRKRNESHINDLHKKLD